MFNKSLFINSTIAFALAVILMITVHEFGHALTAISYGLHPIVYPSSVDPGTASNAQNIVIDLGGPIVSLITGILILLTPWFKRGFLGLFWLWLGLLSVQEFVGYLITAPFGGIGDIGDALHRLGAPFWVALLVFVVGCAGEIYLGRLATIRFLRFTDPAVDIPGQMRSIGLFAWLAGVLLTVILSIGTYDASATSLFELFGLLTSGIFITLVRYFLPRVKAVGQRQALHFPVIGSVILTALAVLRLFILIPGLHL